MAIARLLEGESPNLLGELGIDTAVNKGRKVQIIEVNYKPGWSEFNDFPHLREKLAHHFLELCQHLDSSGQ